MYAQLNDNWRLACDRENQGRTEKWFEAVRPDAQPAPVPGTVQQLFPEYRGVTWYWHTFSQSRMPGKDERCLLRFGAVEYLAEVWLNGVAAGRHEDAEYEITDLDRPDAPATMRGRELMETGVAIAMREEPQAVVLRHTRR